jgi:hypothetical protein
MSWRKVDLIMEDEYAQGRAIYLLEFVVDDDHGSWV